MRLFVLLLCCTACAGVGVRDVQTSFAEEYALVRLRVPSQKDPACGRAHDPAMTRTVALADEYLAQHQGSYVNDRFVRALLACALLMRGETLEACDVLHDVQPDRSLHLSYENQVISAARHAVSACRSVEARAALLACFNEELPIEEFLEAYGSFIAVELPSRSNPNYDSILKYHATEMRERCFSRLDGDPRAMELGDRSRSHYRRLLGEQIYNDAASLLAGLPDPEHDTAESRYLAAQSVSLFVVYAFVMPDLMAMRLSANQKQWKWELANSVFREVKETSSRFLTEDEKLLVSKFGVKGEIKTPADARRHLYAKLLSAQSEVRGWIQTR